jgi:hypothetical protein
MRDNREDHGRRGAAQTLARHRIINYVVYRFSQDGQLSETARNYEFQENQAMNRGNSLILQDFTSNSFEIKDRTGKLVPNPMISGGPGEGGSNDVG